MPTRRSIEIWYDFGSNYSYLSVIRMEEASTRLGLAVVWKPFLLGPIFKSFGWSTSPFVLQKEKGDYMWKDMVRECRKYGVPWTRPTVYPRISLLAARVALLGADQPWIGGFSREIMLMNFARDRDINSPGVVGEVLTQLGLPAAKILEEAQTEQNKLRLREQTETAKAKGVFGAPTFFVGEEMFWGNDRLDDALAYAAST